MDPTVRNIRVADPRDRVPRGGPHPKRPDPLRDRLATLPILVFPFLLLLMLTRASAAGPELTVSPGSATPGLTISVRGSGFERDEGGVLTWDGAALEGATYRSNGHGTFEVTIVVPASAPIGVHDVAAIESQKPKTAGTTSSGIPRARTSVEVVAASAVDSEPSGTPTVNPVSHAPAPSSSGTTGPSPSPTPTASSSPGPDEPTATLPPSPSSSPIAAAPSTPAPSAALETCPSSLQAAVDAAPTGSVLSVPNCIFRETVRIDKALTVVTVGGQIDGEGVRTYGLVIGADDVTIDGFEVTRTTNSAQDGAIRVRNADRFTLRAAHVHHTGGACISVVGGTGHRIVNSELAYCAQEGFHISGVSATILAGNRIHHNNPNLAYDVEWEAGGGKATAASGLTFESNHSWSNNGPGLWCDIDCRNVTFRANRVWSNSRAGIFFEISSGALIEGNVAWHNGFDWTPWGWGAGVVVSSSSNVEVRDNVVAWNADGISIISQDRGQADWNSVTGVSVHHNDIIVSPHSSDTSDKYLLAWLQDHDGVMFHSASGNIGAANRYWHSIAEPSWGRFAWSGPKSTLLDFNNTSGEEGGEYVSEAELEQVLSEAGIPTSP